MIAVGSLKKLRAAIFGGNESFFECVGQNQIICGPIRKLKKQREVCQTCRFEFFSLTLT